MNQRDAFYLRLGLIIVAVASLSGVVLLLSDKDFRQPSTGFELLVFMMSAVALTLAVIQGVSIDRQLRETKKSSIRISRAVSELEALTKTEKKQNNLIYKDLELDKVLIDFLSKHDIVPDNKELESIKNKISKTTK